jgi:hypothetical protein
VLIDCDRCAVRGAACSDCVVTVLLGGPPDELVGGPDTVVLDAASRDAIAVLADSGLIPPLRLVLSSDSDSAPVTQSFPAYLDDESTWGRKLPPETATG